MLSSGVGGREAPTQRRARSPAALPRGVRASACDPDRPGRRRDTQRRVVAAILAGLPRPSRRAGGGRAPSTQPRPGVGGRRTPAQLVHAQRRAGARRTLHTGVPARPSAPRTVRRAAARCGAAPQYKRRRPALPGESRPGSAGAGADRAHHHARAACVTCLCQLGEYSARSGRPRWRRIRLSASSNWFASPMSNHWPSNRYA